MTSKRVASLAARLIQDARTAAERTVAASALSDRKKPSRKACRRKPVRKTAARKATRRSGRR